MTIRIAETTDTGGALIRRCAVDVEPWEQFCRRVDVAISEATRFPPFSDTVPAMAVMGEPFIHPANRVRRHKGFTHIFWEPYHVEFPSLKICDGVCPIDGGREFLYGIITAKPGERAQVVQLGLSRTESVFVASLRAPTHGEVGRAVRSAARCVRQGTEEGPGWDHIRLLKSLPNALIVAGWDGSAGRYRFCCRDELGGRFAHCILPKPA
jgi:hypothetical protein